jgi:hypothetical protein
MTLEGRTLHTLCLFGEPGDLGVLGAYALEAFGLAIDPVQRRLVPTILYGAAAMGVNAAPIAADACRGETNVVDYLCRWPSLLTSSPSSAPGV